MKSKKQVIESVLADFKIKGKVLNVQTGPVVTLYEFQPAPGIKSSRVIGLADDIARVMSAVSCRVATVPGKDVIGIELPNKERSTVKFDDLIERPSNGEKLPWALGVDIGGNPVMVDIAKFPHLLMAGTTGSGKSVAMNTLILSLLKKLSANECKFIMIDPKQLEMSVYADIPHLLSPIVTDSHKAVDALAWAVSEMEDRYRKMAGAGVRNIGGYNEQAADKLPYIVVVIDEVADLMMVAGQEVETYVQRLAQMARAAGIHVIMATQRPSVDVITGTIKANFPTRVSFAVTSKFDSRTILGEQGAEQLLGMGDMLYMSGGGRIQRVHGAFVPDAEIVKFTDELRASGKPEYASAFTEREEAATPLSSDEYERAKAIVFLDGKATTAYLQRRLGTFYNRAAEYLERMEREGVVGPADANDNRKVLVPYEW